MFDKTRLLWSIDVACVEFLEIFELFKLPLFYSIFVEWKLIEYSPKNTCFSIVWWAIIYFTAHNLWENMNNNKIIEKNETTCQISKTDISIKLLFRTPWRCNRVKERQYFVQVKRYFFYNQTKKLFSPQLFAFIDLDAMHKQNSKIYILFTFCSYIRIVWCLGEYLNRWSYQLNSTATPIK